MPSQRIAVDLRHWQVIILHIYSNIYICGRIRRCVLKPFVIPFPGISHFRPHPHNPTNSPPDSWRLHCCFWPVCEDGVTIRISYGVGVSQAYGETILTGIFHL